jgi:cytidylate kinase
MYQKTAADHFAEAITRLSNQPNPLTITTLVPGEPDLPRAAPAAGSHGRPLTIAFSREAGSGGITVANEVGRRLNWPVFDQQILENLAKDLKVDVTFVEDYDERRGSWLVDTIKAFSAAGSVSEVAYFHRLVRMLQALGARGECVIVGRGSTYVLPLDTTLRVRIVASRDDRVAFIAQERQLSELEAARFVDTKDRDRLKFIKDHFHKEPSDPLSYDLIINRSRFSVDETAEMVIEALQRMQARKGAEKAR